MNIMKRQNIVKVAVSVLLAGFTACANDNEGVLLKGKLVGATVEDALITYSPDGNLYDNQMTPFEVKEDGLFTYNTELAGETADVTIEMDGIGYFGVHLTKDKTVKMTIEQQGDEWQATFEGPGADISRYYNDLTQRFDAMKYWSPDPSESKPIAEYRAILDENYAALQKSVADIKDAEQRDYYTKLTESQYRWLTIRLIMDSCENDNSEYKMNAEFQQLVKGIDVNDPIHLKTNMAFTALNSLNTVKDDGDNGASCTRLMELTDSLVTNPAMRHFMVQMIGQQYYIYGNGEGDYEAFNKKYLEWAGEDKAVAQAMIDQFMQKKQSTEATKTGQLAPDVELTTPDGKKVKLSSLLKGKFTYIDVWATWCGPCCKEIPFVEKLVEQYKGNDKVQFLSISIDQNEKAWKTKLEKDKPQWPQFIIQGEVEAKFSKDWGITGIPRFIMINPDGTIFSGDATRPSSPETAQTIDQQIGK